MVRKVFVGLLAGFAALSVAGTAVAGEKEEARRHFKTGMKLIENGDYDKGIAELKQAYEILPHANVLYNIARAYAEAGWAFYTDVCQEWELQFGFDYAPMYDTGIHGAPFVAANGHLREEVNYSGNMVVQAGWAWRTGPNAHLFRVGAEYFNGLSDQYQFWNQFEEKIGIGMWYDY